MKYRTFGILLAAFILTACASVRTHRKIVQPTGVTLNAGVGSTLFRLNKVGDLPNAVGGRDIWGGKVGLGYSEAKLLSIHGAELTLAVTDVDQQSTETVMDRYKPFANRAALVSVDVTNQVNIGGSEHGVRPSIVKFNSAQQRELVLGGVKLSIIAVEPYSVRYTIEDTFRR